MSPAVVTVSPGSGARNVMTDLERCHRPSLVLALDGVKTNSDVCLIA